MSGNRGVTELVATVGRGGWSGVTVVVVTLGRGYEKSRADKMKAIVSRCLIYLNGKGILCSSLIFSFRI